MLFLSPLLFLRWSLAVRMSGLRVLLMEESWCRETLLLLEEELLLLLLFASPAMGLKDWEGTEAMAAAQAAAIPAGIATPDEFMYVIRRRSSSSAFACLQNTAEHFD